MASPHHMYWQPRPQGLCGEKALMGIRTAEKWCWSHTICAFLRMQLDLNYIKLIDKTVVSLLVFTAHN